MALFSNILRLSELDATERRVLVRADLAPRFSSFGALLDDVGLRAALPTLRTLLSQRAKLVIGWHAEPTTTDAVPSNAAGSVARRMSELLGQPVALLGGNFSGEIAQLAPGEVALTPNLGELEGERTNDPAFALQVAKAIDVYVADDVRAAALPWASSDALPRLLPARGCGLELNHHLEMLELLATAKPVRPLVAAIGGDGFARRARLLWALLPRVDAFVLGGVLANTCLAALGQNVGASSVETTQIEPAREFLAAARAANVPVHLPVDALVLGAGAPLGALQLRSVDQIASEERIVDIAIETSLAYRDVLSGAGSVFWSGLMGTCGIDDLRSGTLRVAQAALSAPRSMIVGERTLAEAELMNVLDAFSLVARGGDAALALMSGSVLPGIEALRY